MTQPQQRGFEAAMLGFSFIEHTLRGDKESLLAVLENFSTKEVLSAMTGANIALITELSQERQEDPLVVLRELRTKFLQSGAQS